MGFDMGFGQSSSFWRFERRGLGFVFRIVFGLWLCLVLSQPVAGLRPLRERARSWGDEVGFQKSVFNFVLVYCIYLFIQWQFRIKIVNLNVVVYCKLVN